MSERSTASPPDPSTASTPAEFVQTLRELRQWAGAPSLRRLRQLAGSTTDTRGTEIEVLPISTTSYVLRGDRLPRSEFVRAFVTACLRFRGRDQDAIAGAVERWHGAWLRLYPGESPPEPGSGDARPAPASPHVPRQLPLDVGGFTGRADELALLHKALMATDRSGPTVVSVISGAGGTGKSALAIHVAHLLADQFPDGQLYVDLHGATEGLAPLASLAVLGRFLRALGVAGGAIPDQLDEAAARFRTVVADRRLLLVLDNAADAAQVRPLLPGTPGCRVLVTSRRALSSLPAANQVHLESLSAPDSVTLLRRLIGAERVASQPAAAAELARRCGRLPLALRIAGARLAARPAWPVATLAQRLADERRRLDELQVADASVRASLGVSYHQLRDSDDPADRAAAQAFGLLGIWDGPDLALPAAARLLDRPEAEAEPLLERLVDAQLLQTRSIGRYRLHDLLRLYARELATQAVPDPERTAALERVLTYYTSTAWHTLPLMRPGAWRLAQADPRWTAGGLTFADRAEAVGWLDAERPNLLAAATQAATIDGLAAAAVQLAHALFSYFYAYHYSQDWERLNHTALDVARGAHDPVAEANIHNDLGTACHHRGRFDQAIEHFQRALAIRRRIGDQEAAARSLSNVGGTYTSLCRYEEALACLNQALAINRRHGNRFSEATCLNNLGLLHKVLGHADDALAHYQQSLAIARELDDRHFQALILNNLGAVYLQQARHHEALDCVQQGLALYRTLENRSGEGMSLDTLGTIHHAVGRYEEALDCYRRGLSVCRELGLRHNEAEVLRNLGATLAALGRADEARAHWQAALAIHEELGLPADELRTLLGA